MLTEKQHTKAEQIIKLGVQNRYMECSYISFVLFVMTHFHILQTTSLVLLAIHFMDYLMLYITTTIDYCQNVF